MSLELVAVEGCEFEAVSGEIDFGGSFSVVTLASTKNLAEGLGIYFGPMIVSVSGMANGNLLQASTVNFTISPGATKLSNTITFAMLEGDSENQVVTFTDTSTGLPVSVGITLRIVGAGQNKVYAQ